MFKKFCIAVLTATFLFTAAAAKAEGFSSAIEDLPIMDGMSEKTDKIVVFDTPEGRIVETTLETSLGNIQVFTYYRQTLQQLGWTSIGGSDRAYQRENEMMVIDMYENPETGTYYVTFKIAPHAPQD